MGVVYEAFDPALGRRVAVKTLSLATSFGPVEREAFEQRFLTEARAAAVLSHPNIVVVHDVGRDPVTGTPYITLEHLEGRTLAEVSLAGEPRDWREALRIVGRLADALHMAHGQGIVHRDVKPANVMLLPSGDPKIMDFGIAKVPASQLTAAGQLFGTPANMSPEQALGEPLDARSDLFSLGTVLYELVTWRRPFFAETLTGILAQVVQQDPPAPTVVRPELPAEVDYLVARSMAKVKALRYPDGRTLAEDIEDVLGGRAPRHRGTWRTPPGHGTVASGALARTDVPNVSVSIAAPPARTSTSLPGPAASGPARRIAILAAAILGGVSLLLVGLWLGRTEPARRTPATLSRPTLAPTTTVPEVTTSGEGPSLLAVEFDHHLRSGVLKLWLDDELVLEEKLEGKVTQRILSFKLRKGTVEERLEVSPGRHKIKVNVTWDDNSKSEWISGVFDPGEKRTLEVNLNRITKDLSLDWQ